MFKVKVHVDDMNTLDILKIRTVPTDVSGRVGTRRLASNNLYR